MTRCGEFYQKWKKEPNFCGMGKNTAATIEKYLALVDEMSESTGLSDFVIFVNMPEGAVKPLLRFKKGSEIRQMAIKKIGQTLKDKHAISLKYTNSILGIFAGPKPFIPITVPAVVQIMQDAIDRKSITDKIRCVNAILDTPMLAKIIDVMKKKGFDNEYQTVIHLIIKGLEVVKNE